MAVTTIIKTIKSIHPDSIILVKVGKFYNVYGKDSYILSYFFNYKLKELDGIVSCGFPIESINKIMAKLENKKINYLIVDRRNNYDVDGICQLFFKVTADDNAIFLCLYNETTDI